MTALSEIKPLQKLCCCESGGMKKMYYPKGVDDEDYCVFKFTAESVNYYHALSTVTISVDDVLL